MHMYGKGGTTGKLLVSAPKENNDIFSRSVVLVLGHDSKGAVGVILNRQTHSLNLRDLCREMHIPSTHIPRNKIRFGGPLSMGTGIVVHSPCYQQRTTISINESCNITACANVLMDINKGQGPEKSLFILGYAGWDSGQLESEMKRNTWILLDPTEDLIFNQSPRHIWKNAMKNSGLGCFAYAPVSGTA